MSRHGGSRSRRSRLIEAAFLADGAGWEEPHPVHVQAERPLVLSIAHNVGGVPLDRWRGGTPHSEWRRLSVACEAPVSAEHVPVRLAGGG